MKLNFSYRAATPSDDLHTQALDRLMKANERGKFDRLRPILEQIAANRPFSFVPTGNFYETLADIRSLRFHVKELKGIKIIHNEGKIITN